MVSFLQGPLTEQKDVDALQKACELGYEASVEIRSYRKDGTPFWNWLRLRPVHDKAIFAGEGVPRGDSK